jgi:hypothetical protein
MTPSELGGDPQGSANTAGDVLAAVGWRQDDLMAALTPTEPLPDVPIEEMIAFWSDRASLPPATVAMIQTMQEIDPDFAETLNAVREEIADKSPVRQPEAAPTREKKTGFKLANFWLRGQQLVTAGMIAALAIVFVESGVLYTKNQQEQKDRDELRGAQLQTTAAEQKAADAQTALAAAHKTEEVIAKADRAKVDALAVQNKQLEAQLKAVKSTPAASGSNPLASARRDGENLIVGDQIYQISKRRAVPPVLQSFSASHRLVGVPSVQFVGLKGVDDWKLTPFSTAVKTLTPTFRWATRKNAVRYSLIISLAGEDLPEMRTDKPEYTVKGLMPGKQYAWHVVALEKEDDGHTHTDDSGPAYFTTLSEADLDQYKKIEANTGMGPMERAGYLLKLGLMEDAIVEIEKGRKDNPAFADALLKSIDEYRHGK